MSPWFCPPTSHGSGRVPVASPSPRAHRRSERGQGTAEYALVLIAVTAMVAVVIAYLSGSGGGLITGLFGAAFARMRSLVGG